MFRKGIIFILFIALLCSFCWMGASAETQDNAPSSEIYMTQESGIDMAVQLSEREWDAADSVFLLSSEDLETPWPAAVLACMKNAPVLLTSPEVLPEKVQMEIQRLKVKEVYLLGDVSRISQEIQNQLSHAYQVVRIGQESEGITVAIAQEIKKLANYDSVILINAKAYVDASIIIPFAAREGIPMFFTTGEDTPDSVMEMVKSGEAHRVILMGGEGVISADVEKQLQQDGAEVVRLGGRNRYLTVLKTIAYFGDEDFSTMVLAAGEQPAHLLLGAVTAAHSSSLVILTQPQSHPQSIREYLKSKGLKTLYVFGGKEPTPSKEGEQTSSTVENARGQSEQSAVQAALKLVKPSIVYGTITERTPYYSTYLSDRKRLGYIDKGERLEVLRDRKRTWYHVVVGEGKTGWIRAGAVRIPESPETNPERMIREQIELFANYRELKSPTPYLVWVDIDRQVTHVLKGKQGEWQLVRSMDCVTGKNETPTTRGLFSIGGRGPWFFNENAGVGAQNWVRFNGPYLFHSVVMNRYRKIVNPTLGKRASAGCIRLSVENSMWFYNTIPEGTTVFVN